MQEILEDASATGLPYSNLWSAISSQSECIPPLGSPYSKDWSPTIFGNTYPYEMSPSLNQEAAQEKNVQGTIHNHQVEGVLCKSITLPGFDFLDSSLAFKLEMLI